MCLLVDLSYSMVLNGTWGPAKQTALALHTLVTTAYPQDALQVVGFSNYARELQPAELAGLDWDMVQGTNLQHALLVAGRFLDQHPDADPVVLVVTDGEPTAHLSRDGRSVFDWPPAPETLELTLAEVDKMTRRGATLNIFMLGDEPRLQQFVETVAETQRWPRVQPGRRSPGRLRGERFPARPSRDGLTPPRGLITHGLPSSTRRCARSRYAGPSWSTGGTS